MPPINHFKCSNCDFSMPSGWGGYQYVIDEHGKRIVCPHPGEFETIMHVLGFTRKRMIDDYLTTLTRFQRILKKIFKPQIYTLYFQIKAGKGTLGEIYIEKTGYNSHCVCLECLNQFDLDIGSDEKTDSRRYHYQGFKKRDSRECPYCKSDNVKTQLELKGNLCPKCKIGIFEEIYTGWIS